MSKYMQIDIRLIPIFEKPFRKVFPKLSKMLKQLSYLRAEGDDVSFYDLVDYLERISLDPKIPADVKESIRPYLKKMLPLKEKAREFLLARKLNELDALLYQLEDLFEDLEKSM